MESLHCNYSGIRRETRLGRDYLVAKLNLIVPGVLNGSRGPLYYPRDEIARSVDQWNGVPLVVYHPTHNGRNVSARSPDVAFKSKVGRVYNAHLTPNGILAAEGWFEVDSLKRVDNRVYEALTRRQPMELSTGLFTENETAPPGSVDEKGRAYQYIARSYKSDHVAILPDQKGACSLSDGCGVVMNSSSDLQWMTLNGGPGSGNFGHKGRPGKRGGSSPKGEATGTITDAARPNLTDDEEWAVEGYTAVSWINDELRGEKIRSDAQWVRPESMENQRKNLHKAMAKTKEMPTPVPVYRVLVFDDQESKKKFLDSLAPGKEVTWPGYVSTSPSLSVAQKYAREGDSVIVKINAVRGLDLQHYGHGDNEGELLLPHNSKFTARKSEQGVDAVVDQKRGVTTNAARPGRTIPPKKSKGDDDEDFASDDQRRAFFGKLAAGKIKGTKRTVIRKETEDETLDRHRKERDKSPADKHDELRSKQQREWVNLHPTKSTGSKFTPKADLSLARKGDVIDEQGQEWQVSSVTTAGGKTQVHATKDGERKVFSHTKGTKSSAASANPIKDVGAVIKSITDEINEIGAKGEKRLSEAKDWSVRALRPSSIDWLETDERERLHELQQKLIPLEYQHFGKSEDRVQIKRDLRRRGIKFATDASLAELKKLQEGNTSLPEKPKGNLLERMKAKGRTPITPHTPSSTTAEAEYTRPTREQWKTLSQEERQRVLAREFPGEHIGGGGNTDKAHNIGEKIREEYQRRLKSAKTDRERNSIQQWYESELHKKKVKATTAGWKVVNEDGASLVWEPLNNAFCATGEGGGVDPSCSPTGKGRGRGKKSTTTTDDHATKVKTQEALIKSISTELASTKARVKELTASLKTAKGDLTSLKSQVVKAVSAKVTVSQVKAKEAATRLTDLMNKLVVEAQSKEAGFKKIRARDWDEEKTVSRKELVGDKDTRSEDSIRKEIKDIIGRTSVLQVAKEFGIAGKMTASKAREYIEDRIIKRYGSILRSYM